jgi:hypothetical protein
VTLRGLQPSSTYYYRCGDPASNTWSDVYSFKTSPLPGSGGSGVYPFSILTYGDMGNWNSQSTFQLLNRIAKNASFVFHVGDIAYADDAFLHNPFVFGYEDAWNEYMRNMSAIASGVPLMVLPGNHEAECHSPACFLDAQRRKAVSNFTAYNHRFRMPSDAAHFNMWYSFDYGNVHFVSIDTETDYPNSPNDSISNQNGNFGNQLAWLHADLADAVERRAKGELAWIIAGGHRPPYSLNFVDASGKVSGEAANTLSVFEPIFAEYAVDMYIAGHVHASEAAWPVYNQTTVFKSYNEPPYTTYVIAGAPGCDEGISTPPENKTTPWERYVNYHQYAVGKIDFLSESSLQWSFLSSTDGSVLDSFTLNRSPETRQAAMRSPTKAAAKLRGGK